MPTTSEIDLRDLERGQVLPSSGADLAPELAVCDREPIHIPGAIQPHGLLLIADAASLIVIGGAGDIETRLDPIWQGRPLADLIGLDVAAALDGWEPGVPTPLAFIRGRGENFHAFVALSGSQGANDQDHGHHVLLTLEPAPPALTTADIFARVETAGNAFERTADLVSLCARAAGVFRDITGFDRVMIYRFLDDGAGLVVAEQGVAELPSFLHHHFPAGDIPRQARALYVRNRVRVIPDIGYAPAPVRQAAPGAADLTGVDLSDVSLRSVSPIHLHYLRNMGVAASASISIVKDGLLWGLVACHHREPRDLSYEIRSACSAIAGGLARQIRAKEEAEVYRERIRLRGAEDVILGQIEGEQPLDDFLGASAGELRTMLGADGFAILGDRPIVTDGVVPERHDLLALGQWLGRGQPGEPFVSRSIAAAYPPAAAWPERASGVLAITVASESAPLLLVWFRVEERERVEWAGNPHKDSSADPQMLLTPRNSFESWSEEVRQRARPWTLAQIEAATRLRRRLLDARQARRLRELNRELAATVAEKEALLLQKDHLLREVNHRVQNSLQLVQSFLALQARAGGDATGPLEEAQRRISAVALVHRRLYQADHLETVDLARYLEDLIGETRAAMGAEWASGLTLDLAPILISADRAIHVGLILTELVINASKYAYDGASGPIAIALEEYRNQFRLIVADEGKGQIGSREGFGSRMMAAMVQRLDGTIERFDNKPGLRVIVSAPAA